MLQKLTSKFSSAAKKLDKTFPFLSKTLKASFASAVRTGSSMFDRFIATVNDKFPETSSSARAFTLGSVMRYSVTSPYIRAPINFIAAFTSPVLGDGPFHMYNAAQAGGEIKSDIMGRLNGGHNLELQLEALEWLRSRANTYEAPCHQIPTYSQH